MMLQNYGEHERTDSLVGETNIKKRRRIKLAAAAIFLTGVSLVGGCGAANKPLENITPLPSAKLEAPSASTLDTPTTSPTPEGPAQFNQEFTEYPQWWQDFTKTSTNQLDNRYWNIYTGVPPANHEDEYYTNSSQNLRIEGGALIIEGRHQSEHGYQYTSARIDTLGKEDFLYGRFDVTAKLPAGIGTWPSIWLYPSRNNFQNESPISGPLSLEKGGEIDIEEGVGSDPNVVYGIAHNLFASETNRSGDGDYHTIRLADEYTNFITYSLEWTPTSLTFLIDNKAYYTYQKPFDAGFDKWPYDKPFYLIINLALGGTWGGMDRAQFPPDGINNNALPATMAIQSVAYYPLINR